MGAWIGAMTVLDRDRTALFGDHPHTRFKDVDQPRTPPEAPPDKTLEHLARAPG
jgi:hypothetical protein